MFRFISPVHTCPACWKWWHGRDVVRGGGLGGCRLGRVGNGVSCSFNGVGIDVSWGVNGVGSDLSCSPAAVDIVGSFV